MEGAVGTRQHLSDRVTQGHELCSFFLKSLTEKFKIFSKGGETIAIVHIHIKLLQPNLNLCLYMYIVLCTVQETEKIIGCKSRSLAVFYLAPVS